MPSITGISRRCADSETNDNRAAIRVGRTRRRHNEDVDAEVRHRLVHDGRRGEDVGHERQWDERTAVGVPHAPSERARLHFDRWRRRQRRRDVPHGTSPRDELAERIVSRRESAATVRRLRELLDRTPAIDEPMVRRRVLQRGGGQSGVRLHGSAPQSNNEGAGVHDALRAEPGELRSAVVPRRN